MDLTKTFYFDDKTARFMLIVWDGQRARHHKLPGDIHTLEDAKALAEKLDLGMDFCGALHDNKGWGKAWKAA